MKFGCCIKNLAHLELIKKIGFDYAEISVKDILISLRDDKEWEINKKIIQQSNFPIEIANSFLNIKVIGENLDYLVIDNYLKNTFERANSIGIKIIGFGSGDARNIPENFPKEKANAQLEKFLNMALKYAEQNSITIGLEPLNKQETNFINSLEEAKQIIKKINNPNLKLTADFYHLNKENEDIENLEDVKKELIHIHVADTLRKYPGLGNSNFKKLFKTLKKINYNSRISIECTLDNFEELKSSLDFLYNLDTMLYK